jgi:hypothetical protein
MKLDALDHPKTLDFADRLGVEIPTAIGHLELLWAFAAKQSPQGNIGKWTNGAIAKACFWSGSPDEFLNCLLKCGLVDEHKTHRLVIHDWAQHCPNWVRAKLSKLKIGFISTEEVASASTEEPSNDASSEPSSRERVPSHALPSHANGESADAPPRIDPRGTRIPEDFELTPERMTVALTENLDPDRTFRNFCDYWRSVPAARARKTDWDATWRVWCRKDADEKKPPASVADKAKRAAADQRALAELRTRAGRIQFRDFNPAVDDLVGYRTLVERAESNLPRRASS